MENEYLDNLWNKQDSNLTIDNASTIIIKAKQQRKGQIIGIIVMSLTVLILVAYTLYILPNKWSNFSLGLVLMISSLTFRIILEIVSIHKKESKLISMDSKSYRTYLKGYYKVRKIINYIVTPICIALYIYGFYLLLPYFKNEFSNGFYTYILISGIASLVIIISIITNSITKEHRLLMKLKKD